MARCVCALLCVLGLAVAVQFQTAADFEALYCADFGSSGVKLFGYKAEGPFVHRLLKADSKIGKEGAFGKMVAGQQDDLFTDAEQSFKEADEKAFPGQVVTSRKFFKCGATAGNRFIALEGLQKDGWRNFCKLLSGKFKFQQDACFKTCATYSGVEEARMEFKVFNELQLTAVTMYAGIGGASMQVRLPKAEQGTFACGVGMNLPVAGNGHAKLADVCLEENGGFLLSFLSDAAQATGGGEDGRVVGGTDQTSKRFAQILKFGDRTSPGFNIDPMVQKMIAEGGCAVDDGGKLCKPEAETYTLGKKLVVGHPGLGPSLKKMIELTVWKDPAWNAFVVALHASGTYVLPESNAIGLMSNAENGKAYMKCVSVECDNSEWAPQFSFNIDEDTFDDDEIEEIQALAEGIHSVWLDKVAVVVYDDCAIKMPAAQDWTGFQFKKGVPNAWACFMSLYTAAWSMTLAGYDPTKSAEAAKTPVYTNNLIKIDKVQADHRVSLDWMYGAIA